MHDGFVEFEADNNANYQNGGTASFSAGGFGLEQDDGCSGIGKATAERFRRKGYRIIGGAVARIAFGLEERRPVRDLCNGLGDGNCKRRVTIEAGDTDLDFGDLSVEVASHEALPE